MNQLTIFAAGVAAGLATSWSVRVSARWLNLGWSEREQKLSEDLAFWRHAYKALKSQHYTAHSKWSAKNRRLRSLVLILRRERDAAVGVLGVAVPVTTLLFPENIQLKHGDSLHISSDGRLP